MPVITHNRHNLRKPIQFSVHQVASGGHEFRTQNHNPVIPMIVDLRIRIQYIEQLAVYGLSLTSESGPESRFLSGLWNDFLGDFLGSCDTGLPRDGFQIIDDLIHHMSAVQGLQHCTAHFFVHILPVFTHAHTQRSSNEYDGT